MFKLVKYKRLKKPTNEDKYHNIKMFLRIIALFLIIIGIFLALDGNSQRNSVELGDDNWFEKSSSGSTKMMYGIWMIMGGTFLLLVSFTRQTSKYAAVETAPAIKISSEALGRGLSEGIQEGGGIKIHIDERSLQRNMDSLPKEIIKIKCRDCGYLETEDAQFCSKCGKPI
jgi:hypothetical protein